MQNWDVADDRGLMVPAGYTVTEGLSASIAAGAPGHVHGAAQRDGGRDLYR